MGTETGGSGISTPQYFTCALVAQPTHRPYCLQLCPIEHRQLLTVIAIPEADVEAHVDGSEP